MWGSLLKQICSENYSDNNFTKELADQNYLISLEIKGLQENIEQLDFEQFYQANKCNFSFEFDQIYKDYSLMEIGGLNKAKALKKYLQTLNLKYSEYKYQETAIEDFKVIKQMAKTYGLIQYVSMFERNKDEEKKIVELKRLIQCLQKELTNIYNQRNINIFQTEDQQECQKYLFSEQFIQKIQNIVNSELELILKSFYRYNSQYLSIKINQFKLLWSENQNLRQCFCKNLHQFFEKNIIYDVNERHYIIQLFKIVEEQNELRIQIQGKINFQNAEIQNHYEQIKTQFMNVGIFFERLIYQVENHTEEIKHIEKELKLKSNQYFQYLYPYMNNEMKRTFLQIFNNPINDRDMNISIYDLLISLKFNCQNGNLFTRTIQSIIQNILRDNQSLDIMMKFIAVSKQNQKLQKMFLCFTTELIEQFDELVEQDSKINYTVIRDLLMIREEMRQKIHRHEKE